MTPPKRRVAVLISVLALVASGCSGLIEQFRNLPELDKKDLAVKLPQSSFIYAADGSRITTVHGTENRTIVKLKQIPESLQDAVIAIEDQRFYEHEGVDMKAILRALVANVQSGAIREGGSTITQQYVKNVIIAPEGEAARTVERKIKEAALARQLEERLTKEQILERYLNTVYFGQGAYGVKAAARTFFHKSLSKLKVHESAMLAGLIKAPENYDPVDNPKKGKQRRDLVLSKMAELGYITETEKVSAQARGLNVYARPGKERYKAPYFVDYVQRLIKFDDRFAEALKGLADTPNQREQLLLTGGLSIYTTIDPEDQEYAEAAIRNTLTEDEDPYGALVSIDPHNGYIRAMVGGRGWFQSSKQDKFAKTNLAVVAEPGLGKGKDGKAPGTGRQAGSAFKTFALAAAIEQGISLSKSYNGNSPKTFPGVNNGGDWIVNNYEGSSAGRVALLEATTRSINVVYAELILELGPEIVTALAKEMGVSTDLIAVPSAVLGANEVNPLGMASGYATLASGGEYNAPVAIRRIEDANGNVLYEHEPAPRRVLDESVAYLTTSALETVIDGGTGTGAQLDDFRDAAGKTGTAQEYRDAWFVGYTPELATAVWVGHPQGQIEMQPCTITHEGDREVCRTPRIGSVTGGSWPADIWAAFMNPALSDEPPTEFTEPDGIVSVEIDTRGNDCLAGPGTPDEYRAYAPFPAGTEPTEVCKIASKIEVPSVQNMLKDDAIRILEDAGFSVRTEASPTAEVPPERVVYQTPAAGTRVPAGASITLGISRPTDANQGPQGTVPGVVGLTQGAAESELEGNGFRARVIIQPESSPGQARKNSGRVWRQSPSAGNVANQGSEVRIWVNP
jgi:penicillin-binding protein 1A